MTKTMLAYLLLGTLSACSMFQSKPLPERIKDGYIAVIAISKEITSGIDAGYYTKEEAKGYVASLDEAHQNLVEADKLLNGGDIKSTEMQLKLVDRALSGARSWLASKKNKSTSLDTIVDALPEAA